MNDHGAFIARLERSLAEGNVGHVRANADRLRAIADELEAQADDLLRLRERVVALLVDCA